MTARHAPHYAASLVLALVAGCIGVKDGPSGDSSSARGPGAPTSDSVAGAVAGVPATPPPTTSPNVAFGPDSATRIRGGPLWTPEAIAAVRNDTMYTLPEIDTAAYPALSATPPSARATIPAAPVVPVRPAGPAPDPAAMGFLMPVVGVKAADLRDTYSEQRGGGTRTHEALDIPAPRGTPVLSATGGRVLKLFESKAGGHMVYATDASERFILMYAHLDSYAPGLAEGQPLRRGQTVGTVGTTGNAPPNVPHLHFAIARTNDVKQWWKGDPVNPYPLLTR